MDQPLIINVAPTGAVADATRNPHVPVTEAAIVADVVACARLGASMVHLHVRDDAGRPSCDPGRYRSLIDSVRATPEGRDLVVCVSLSGRHGQTPEQRAAVLDLPGSGRPDMGSLTLSSMNFAGGPSINSPDTIRYLARRMQERGVRPELEVFDLGMLHFAKVLIAERLIEPPYYFNLLLGNVAGLQCELSDVAAAVHLLPPDSQWSLAGIARQQRPATALGCVVASGVRIGLEDNLWHVGPDGRELATNPGLVRSVADLAAACGRALARGPEVRSRLRLGGAAQW